MMIDLDRDVWDDLARSLRGPAGDLISPGTIQNFEEGYRIAIESGQPVVCGECGQELFECVCDKEES
jgi:hypothetical protein